MKDLIKLILLVGVLVIGGLYLTGELAEKQAAANYSRAVIIEAQSQARLDLMGSMMPYTILGLGVLAATVVVVVIALLVFAILFVLMNRDALQMRDGK